MSDKAVNVTFDLGAGKLDDKRVAKLRALGLKVGAVMSDIGVVSGRASEAAISKLRKAPGVVAVESDSEVKLAPPGKPQ